MWEGKRVTVLVTGGIAAYKVCSLVSTLAKQGAKVQVAMTEAATSFVSPQTFAALTGNPVHTQLFQDSGEILHIKLGQQSDLVVVAPATANILAKAALGIADDLVSAVLVAASTPVVLVPAMNTVMWRNPAVQANVHLLTERGYRVVTPDSGTLACKSEGEGRFPPLETVLDELERALTPQVLAGKNVLVTAGPTREYLDPVRYLSNPSTGLMGLELARAAWLRGACVTVITGPISLVIPDYLKQVSVVSAREMHQAVLKHFPEADILFMTAAVADYRPALEESTKIKKTGGKLTSIPLERNPDILQSIMPLRHPGQVVVGFAAETESTEIHALAREKLAAKKLDYIVANLVDKTQAGFGCRDQEKVFILGADGFQREYSGIEKRDLASSLCDLVSGARAG
ncbi:MAG: bifunctional phosphopantothenoylcysteine decarboxylase/phosphopantothenate--cysteine ligase CoaBC [Firmicutes bacterium]|nr:bifunctional phosphopantothenoylcysteine decarboxylase/phosphopantothenate--cysteine ligase CoaBC [Bacillota bacterium]